MVREEGAPRSGGVSSAFNSSAGPVSPPSSSSAKAGPSDSATATLKGNRWVVSEEEEEEAGPSGPGPVPLSVPHPDADAQQPQPPPLQQHSSDSRCADTPDASPKRRSPTEPSLTSLPQGSSWLMCLLPTILSLAGIIAGAVVLGVHGSGDESAFRCDLAGGTLSAATFLFFIGLLVMEIFFSKQQVSAMRWLAPLQLILAVNAVGLVALALLGHATWALVQIFAVLASSCWTLVCCWASAAVWRSGIPAPAQGETNLMRAIRNIPKITAMVCWLFFVACGYGAMYFKPLDKVGFSDQITRFEHFFLLLVGGVWISGFCAWAALCLLPRGRRLLLLGDEKVSNLSYCQLIFRSWLVATGTHFLSGAFVAFTFNWVVTILAILLAKLAIRGARTPLAEAELLPEDESASIRLSGRVRKKSCREKSREWCLTGLLMLFSALRVVAVFMVFFFDLTFVQSYMMGTRQRDFILASSGLACGARGDLLSQTAQDPAACMALAVDLKGSDSFLFGTGAGVSGHCYAQTVPVDINSYIGYRSAAPQGNQSCPGSAGVWQDAAGFDFYVLAPSCRVGNRRLTEEDAEEEMEEELLEGQWRRLREEEKTTLYSFQFPFHIGEAARNVFGEWFQSGLDGYMKLLRNVFNFGNFGIPQAFQIKCTGFRRIVSASMVLGAIMIVVTLTSMDLLSIMAASNEIAKVRAARLESFKEYMYMITRAALLQQLVLLMLQVTISWGATLVWEAGGIFAQHCGYLVHEGHLSGTACPNAWHPPVDILASAMLFVGILLGTVTFFSVMSGALYGLMPARWAVKALFGQELHVDAFGEAVGEEDGEEGRADAAVQLEQPKVTCHWSWLLRPFMGLGVSFGWWTTSFCRNYQCGHRQDWYEPISGQDADDDDPRANGELVDFRCIYEATSHNISIVWVPVPMIGAIMSKGAMYLNQYVIFAFGEDGGGTGRKPQRMISHFQEDTPRMVHLLHWVFSACLFFMILAINCDFFGVEAGARLVVLSICLVVVLAIAIMRVAVDLVKELRVFRQGKNLIRYCKRVVEDTLTYQDGVISQVAKFDSGHSQVNPLQDLPHCERSHLVRAAQACKDLLELPWVRERRLPPDVMSRLVAAKNSLGPQNSAIKRLLEQSEDAAADPHREAVLLAGTILYIHQAVYHEICAHRSRVAARHKAYQAAQEAARAAGKEMEQAATAEACSQAAAMAALRVREYQEVVRLASRQQELRPVGGQVAAEPPELVRRLALEFEAHSKGTAKISAHLVEEHGGRELIDPQIAEVMVVVSGKVELTWPRDKDPSSFLPADVQVKAVRHQIVGNFDAELATRDGEDVTPLDREESKGKLMTVTQSGKDWLCGLCVQEDGTQACQCLRVSSRKQNHVIAAGTGLGQIWRLTDLGVDWESADLRSRPSDGGSDGGCASITLAPSSGGGSCPTSSFRVRRMSPPPMQYSLRAGETEQPTGDLIEQLEAALRESVNNPQTLALAGAFMSALGSDRRHMGHEQADRCSRLMAVASKILRTQKRHEGPRKSRQSVEFEEAIDIMHPVLAREDTRLTTAPVDMRISALEALREALARDDLSSDELSFAIERAKRADVDPMILAKAEDKFRMLIARQRACLSLIKATESRMIQQLRDAIQEARHVGLESGDYPDKAGVGVLRKAQSTLVEEERNVIEGLKDAIKNGGALQLRRALQQVKDMGVQLMSASAEDVQELIEQAERKLNTVGEKKRLIALLKMAMTSGNAGLLKAAVAECEQWDSPDDSISLSQAKKRLETLEKAGDNFKEKMLESMIFDASGTISPELMMKEGSTTQSNHRASNISVRPPSSIVVSPPLPRESADSLKSLRSVMSSASVLQLTPEQARAATALRAALYQEPVQLQMLQLAVKEAKQAGLDGDDLAKAQELIASLTDQETALDALRKAAAERDVGNLSAAIKHCHYSGVEQKKLLFAVQQLMEEQAKVARVAGDHGLGISTLADLERERRDLHNSILDSYGGLRCLCRIRPQAPSDPPPLKTSTAPVFQRADRHTLLLARDGGPPKTVRFSSVFGPDCIQAEVFNDLRGLAQSAVDGYNVLIMTGGPPGAGKTFSMHGGGGGSEQRGIVPRMIDEIFLLRDRDSWRANLEVDTQVVEVLDTRKIGDLLSRGAGRPGLGPSVRLVPQGVGQWDAFGSSKDRQLVIVDGAVTRRAATKNELRRIVQDAMRSPSSSSRSRHVLLLVTLTRTNRATGTMTRSKLALADLAGLGQTSTSEVVASYRAMEAVFKALSQDERRPPFRDHALTQVLQDCMGGSAKTVMLLTLPPPDAARSSVECMDAISFATCAAW